MTKGIHLPRVSLNCARCGKRFSRVGSDTDRRHYSWACAKPRPLPRETRQCADCGKPFLCISHHPTRYCSQGCHLKHLAEARRREAGTLGHIKRAKAVLLAEKPYCSECGWDALPPILEIHHKDRNQRHNRRENLLLVCPNCHSAIHYKSRDGQYKNNLGQLKAWLSP